MRHLLVALVLLSSLFAYSPRVEAGSCLQNGGDRLGCVPITGVYWKGVYGSYHDSLMGAIQNNAARWRDITPTHAESYGEGPQFAPISYALYSICAQPVNKIDDTYTEVDHPTYTPGGSSIYYMDVQVYGYRPHSTCTGAQQYASAKAWTVSAHPKCPQGYYPTRDEPASTSYPYGFWCIPNEGLLTISSVESKKPQPDCQDAPTDSCSSTSNPINIVTRTKNQQIEDLRVAGPWPLYWMRTSAQVDSDFSWHWSATKSLTVSPIFPSGTYSGYHVASIKRRNGGFISYKALPVSGGPRTWAVVSHPHYYKNTLEDVWAGGSLSHWVLKRRDGIKEIYSAQGKFLRETSANGQNHHYTHDASGRVTGIRDDFSHSISVSYTNAANNGFGSIASFSYPVSGLQGEYSYSTSIFRCWVLAM